MHRYRPTSGASTSASSQMPSEAHDASSLEAGQNEVQKRGRKNLNSSHGQGSNFKLYKLISICI